MQYSMGEIANYDYRIFKKGAEENTQYFTMHNTHGRQAAFFATGTYAYKGRYSLNGTIRYEGSNRLGKSRSARWLPTWNVSGRWNISDEKWMRPLQPYLSHAALKASYSLTAESGPSWVTNSNVVIAATNRWRPSAFDKETILYIDDLANPDLTFEKKHELNLGVELGFFDNRVNFLGDVYWRNNHDLIIKPYVIVEKAGLKIGVIGVLCDLKSMVAGDIAERVPEFPMLETVQKYADLLKVDEGCDLVIALTHIGYTEHTPGDITDPILCAKTRNLDLIVGGHSHTFLEEMVYLPNVDGVPTPIVQDGCYGVFWGRIDYSL